VLVIPVYQESTLDLVGVGPLVEALKDRVLKSVCQPFYVPSFLPFRSRVLVLPVYHQSTLDLVGVGPLVEAEKDRLLKSVC
jgi:hypothetical protein